MEITTRNTHTTQTPAERREAEALRLRLEGLQRFGTEVRRRRLMMLHDGRPMTLRELCRRLGVSPGYWSALENASASEGRSPSRPGPDLLRKVSNELGYPLIEIVRDLGELGDVFEAAGAPLMDSLRLMSDGDRWALLQAILAIEEGRRGI